MNEKPQATKVRCERFNPDYTAGLSDIQVAQRTRQGFVNGTDEIRTKSIAQIVRDNLITFSIS